MKLTIFILFILISVIPSLSIKITVINIISIVWFVFSLIYVLYIYYKKDKEYDIRYTNKYCEYIPNNRSPEFLGFLLDGHVKKEHLISSILDLIRKKIISIGKFEDTNEYVLVNNKQNSEYISKTENYLIKWLFNSVGNGEYVTFNQIRRDSTKNSGYFYYCYKEYKELVNFESAKYNFFESKKDLLENIFVYFIVSYLITAYNIFIVHNYIVAIIIFILTTAFIIYVNKFYKRTKEANREYEEWKAFSRFTKEKKGIVADYDKVSYELCIVYSPILKTINEMMSTIKKREDVSKSNFLSSYKLGIVNKLVYILSNSIKTAETQALLYAKNNGSSSSRRLKNDKKIEIIFDKE